MCRLKTSPDQYKTSQALCFSFKTSNNEIEYEAVIAGLGLARELGVQDIEIFSDSMLIANQVTGEFQAKEEQMVKYLEKVKTLLGQFRNQLLTGILRSENIEADALAQLASGNDLEGLVLFPIERLDRPSIEREKHVLYFENATTWMDPIISSLIEFRLPENREKAEGLRTPRLGTRLLMENCIVEDILPSFSDALVLQKPST